MPNEDLAQLDRMRYDELRDWLDRALRGRESLPFVVPDETPESPILRERRLSPRTRDDLREACHELVRDFARDPRDDDAYVLALLRLAVGLKSTEIANDLHALASDHEAFEALSPTQSWAVLSTLLDLRAPLPLAFWRDIARRDPRRFGTMAVAGLLNYGYRSAFEVVAWLPDDQTVADTLYVVLDQHARQLNAEERGKMTEAARQSLSECRQQIKEAMQEWIETVSAAGL